jgi:hypothetical protein
VDLAMKALAKDVVTSIIDINFVVNSKVEVEVMTIILTAATHREVIYVEVTLKTKGLVIDIATIIHVNNLESTIFITRKATSLYNTL